MADEPVSAWREPLARGAARWATRNRTAVTGAAAAVVAGVVGLSAVLAVQTRAKAAAPLRETSQRRAGRPPNRQDRRPGTTWPSRRSRRSTPASARTSCSSRSSSRSCATGC